jgi:hypothetical protein
MGTKLYFNLVDLYLEDKDMSFMDKLNATAKKRQMQTAVPKSPTAQNNITDNSYKLGKSRVQESQGVMQGNKGWQSQYGGDGGYGKQINPIINSLSNTPTYRTPKIEHSLLTNEGFNEALGVVGARNNAKLASQHQRVLQGVLGSLISGDSQNRATVSRANIARMRDTTDRRGQDLEASAQADALGIAKDRNTTQSEYYHTLGDIGKERNSIARDRLLNEQNNNQNNSMQEQLFRAKRVPDGNSFKAMLSKEVADEIGSHNLETARQMYINTGVVPSFKKVDNGSLMHPIDFISEVFDDDYAPIQQQPANAPTQQQPKQGVPSINGAVLDRLAKGEGIDRADMRISDDGKSVKLPNGSVASIDAILERYGDNNGTR